MSRSAISYETLLALAEESSANEGVRGHDAAGRAFFAALCGTVRGTCGEDAANQLASAAGFDHLVRNGDGDWMTPEDFPETNEETTEEQ